MIPKDLIVFPIEDESWLFETNVRDPQRCCDPCYEALQVSARTVSL